MSMRVFLSFAQTRDQDESMSSHVYKAYMPYKFSWVFSMRAFSSFAHTWVFVETKDCISSSMPLSCCSCCVTEAAIVLCKVSS